MLIAKLQSMMHLVIAALIAIWRGCLDSYFVTGEKKEVTVALLSGGASLALRKESYLALLGNKIEMK